MAAYPNACYSATCGRILCDGCEVRPALVQWYRATGGDAGVAGYEERQARLRQQKAERTGPFDYLRDNPHLAGSAG